MILSLGIRLLYPRTHYSYVATLWNQTLTDEHAEERSCNCCLFLAWSGYMALSLRLQQQEVYRIPYGQKISWELILVVWPQPA